MLNLIQDIAKVAIVAKLRAWLEAYSTFVSSVGDFLFGWIRFSWIEISSDEYHVLVLATIFCAAAFRAQYVYEQTQRDPYPMLVPTFIALLYFLCPFLLVLFLPGQWGLGAGILGLVIPFGVSIFNDSPGLAPGTRVRTELIGIVGIVLVTIAVNYSVLWSNGG